MTKLAPIEELAKQFASFVSEDTTARNNCYDYYEFHPARLEDLRQAIIKDFVSTLEPKWFHHEESGEHIFMNIVFGLPDETPLYDLSEWKTK